MTESSVVMARGWWMEEWELLLNGSKVLVLQNEEFWKWKVVTVHNNMNAFNSIETYTYKWL